MLLLMANTNVYRLLYKKDSQIFLYMSFFKARNGKYICIFHSTRHGMKITFVYVIPQDKEWKIHLYMSFHVTKNEKYIMYMSFPVTRNE